MILSRLLLLQELLLSMSKTPPSTTLLGVRMTNPEKSLTENPMLWLLDQLERLLVLVIDERSMISSKVLVATEQNTREYIYRGQNSSEV